MLKLPKSLIALSFQFARKLKSSALPQNMLNMSPSHSVQQQNINIQPIPSKLGRRSHRNSLPEQIKQFQLTPEQLEEKLAVEQSKLQMKQLAEQFQPISKQKIQAFKQKTKNAVTKELSYEGQDPNPSKLVNRPAKGAVWGLGGQLILADRKVELQGVRDDPEQIAKFLQLHQVKNIYVHDWHKDAQPDMNRKRYSIIGSCYSARHCWKTAIQLKNAFNKHMLSKKRNKTSRIDAITALMVGKKDDEWTMVEYKQFQVSLMTEQQREAVDLEWKWNNPVPEEVVEKHYRQSIDKKRRKGNFQDFD